MELDIWSQRHLVVFRRADGLRLGRDHGWLKCFFETGHFDLVSGAHAKERVEMSEHDYGNSGDLRWFGSHGLGASHGPVSRTATVNAAGLLRGRSRARCVVCHASERFAGTGTKASPFRGQSHKTTRPGRERVVNEGRGYFLPERRGR